MNTYDIPASMTALAIAIAEATPDNDELYLIGATFIELGATLQTIVAQRLLKERHNQALATPPA